MQAQMMRARLEKALKDHRLSAPAPLVETPGACLWRVRGAGSVAASEMVLKLYRKGHAGNEAAGAALMRQWARSGAPVWDILAWEDDLWLMPALPSGTVSLGDHARAGIEDGNDGLLSADAPLGQLARALHQGPQPDASALPDLASWFDALFDLRYAPECAAPLRADMQRAAELARGLLATTEAQHALHGDIHHDNAVQLPDGACVLIDAKGVRGDPLYDLANAMRNPKGCAALIRDRALALARLKRFAEALDGSPARFAAWVAAKSALSIAWRARGLLRSDKEADLLSLFLSLAEAGSEA